MKEYNTKDEYDFSKAEQGKFYVAPENTQIPIYLEDDVVIFLRHKLLVSETQSLQTLVNELLRKDIDIFKTFKTL
ncbi:MAG: hypothetical protein SFU25_08965 [Candidatus Caenarcaniphilales bacterium]|nr:hypothetical protein [Candidatus Caenarcaniphilales bacterium]